MRVIAEPTPEMDELSINGVKVPVRIWRGTTYGGIELEILVLSFMSVNSADHARLQAEQPSYIKPSRDTFKIAFPDEQAAEAEAWAKSMHETGGPPDGKI